MRKLLKFVCVVILVVEIFFITGLIMDKFTLHEDLIRLHVVANSDAKEDQNIKLQVRDAIVAYLQPILEEMPDKEQAYAYIQEHLQVLADVANQTLQKLGASAQATVELIQEEFDTRHYDTFSLPSGVYDSLRITIGNGEGKNWWCVVFPSLCVPAAAEDFQDTAVSSGLNENLTNTLTHEEGYEIRFFLLDCLGRLENFFWKNG